MKKQLTRILCASLFSFGLLSTADAALTEADYLAGGDNLAVFDSSQLMTLPAMLSTEYVSY